MPPDRQPTQKRRRLPFKPPSRASASASASESTTAGPSKTKPSTKKNPKPTTTASSSKSKPTAGPSNPSNRRNPSPPPTSSASGSESGSESSASDADSDPNRASPIDASEANYILAEITHKDNTADDVISSEPLIPQKLLTRLLHHHFRNEKTKIAKDANAVVAKYIDVYVREAVARAAYERAEGGDGGVGDGFLEVEDLEKMGPQLAMDF
ncbi:CENP-S associating centromere protein X-domain-containing protein [Aspergillus egyptiacus]|nr:CENP-S associating centromere protein X-domain-containing protein [Aspergillus egyptiacus]